MKVQFHYMYRDGDNYKRGASMLVNSPDMTPEACGDLEGKLKETLSDGEYFIAHQVGVPECFSWNPDADYDPDDASTHPQDLGPGKYMINDSDHCWHEFEGLSLVDDTKAEAMIARGTPVYEGSVEDLIKKFEEAKLEGWDEFDIHSRKKQSRPAFR